jgi:hypothetical protein
MAGPRTTIRILRTRNPVIPKAVQRERLRFHLDIVQDTHRADSVDMFFDEPLWNALLDFASTFTTRGVVTVIQRPMSKRGRNPRVTDETALLDYFSWPVMSAEERGPAEAIIVRRSGVIVLYIATLCWANVGGPSPYHDSYTYSVYSRASLDIALPNFLARHRAVPGWDLAAPVSVPVPLS